MNVSKMGDKSKLIDWEVANFLENIDSEEGQNYSRVADESSREADNPEDLETHEVSQNVSDTVEAPWEDEDPNKVCKVSKGPLKGV